MKPEFRIGIRSALQSNPYLESRRLLEGMYAAFCARHGFRWEQDGDGFLTDAPLLRQEAGNHVFAYRDPQGGVRTVEYLSVSAGKAEKRERRVYNFCHACICDPLTQEQFPESPERMLQGDMLPFVHREETEGECWAGRLWEAGGWRSWCTGTNGRWYPDMSGSSETYAASCARDSGAVAVLNADECAVSPDLGTANEGARWGKDASPEAAIGRMVLSVFDGMTEIGAGGELVRIGAQCGCPTCGQTQTSDELAAALRSGDSDTLQYLQLYIQNAWYTMNAFASRAQRERDQNGAS